MLSNAATPPLADSTGPDTEGPVGDVPLTAVDNDTPAVVANGGVPVERARWTSVEVSYTIDVPSVDTTGFDAPDASRRDVRAARSATMTNGAVAELAPARSVLSDWYVTMPPSPEIDGAVDEPAPSWPDGVADTSWVVAAWAEAPVVAAVHTKTLAGAGRYGPVPGPATNTVRVPSDVRSTVGPVTSDC